VQTANGGVAAGRLDLGDTVTYTFSRQVQPGTVTAGWTGDPLAVQLRLRDGIGLGLGSKGDSVDVLRNGAAVQLGLLTLRENYIQKNRTLTFNATLSLATVMVDGVARSRVTVTLGAVASGNGQRTVSNGSTMTWAPAAAVLDAGGSACSAAPVTEAGGLDREF
jgi:hypothetical protein